MCREEGTCLYYFQQALESAGPKHPGDEANDRLMLVLPAQHQSSTPFSESTGGSEICGNQGGGGAPESGWDREILLQDKM